MTALNRMLEATDVNIGAVAEHLNGLEHDDRVREVRSVPGKLQGRLFAAASGFASLDQEYFVPKDEPDQGYYNGRISSWGS